jgi:hypothetical protein
MQQSKSAKRPTTLAITILLIITLSCIVFGISLYFTKGFPIVYWFVAPNIYVVPFIIITLGLGFLALIMVRIFRRFQFGLFVIAGVISCLCLLSFYWGSMTHQDSIAFSGHVYHLALRDDAQWSDYVLCECDNSGILCQCHAFYSRYILGRPSSNTLSADNATNELRVTIGKDVIYTYGATQRCFPVDGVCLDK